MRGKTSAFTGKSGAGELAIIERIRGRASGGEGRGVSLGIGDDCALLRLKAGEEAAVTTDLSIEGRHFRLESHPAEAIGHRTLARGLSDIAAMGARPVAAFLSLGLPGKLTRARVGKTAWVDRFLEGFLALAERHRTPLAGGDLAESAIAVADIVVMGAVPRGEAMLRSGARPGDLIYVTGMLGGSSAGLRKLVSPEGKRKGKQNEAEVAAHLWPEPRIAQGLWLRGHGAATAAIDISDGLSTDLEHLCTESGVSAEIDAEGLPVAPGATLQDALHGGEDYELLFTARRQTKIPGRIAGVPVSRIGRIGRLAGGETSVNLWDSSGRRPLDRGGWEHFEKPGERG